jgi:hypothetical protein
MGDSRGSWDGNTLVVDVTNLNAKNWLDQVGNFFSDNAHVVERFTLAAANIIDYEVDIDDTDGGLPDRGRSVCPSGAPALMPAIPIRTKPGRTRATRAIRPENTHADSVQVVQRSCASEVTADTPGGTTSCSAPELLRQPTQHVAFPNRVLPLLFHLLASEVDRSFHVP